MEAFDRVGISAFVESGFFDRRANEQTAIAARNQIGQRRTDDVLQQRFRWHHQAEHLTFHRPRRESMRTDFPRPRTGTIHDFRREK